MNFHLLFRKPSLRFSSHLQDFFVCNSFLPAYLKYPSKKTLISFSSLLFIFHVSQPYFKTGFTSVLYSLTLVRRLMLMLLQIFFNLIKNTPPRFDYSVVDVFSASALFGNRSSQVHKSINIFYSSSIHFQHIIVPRIYSQ